MLAFFLASFHAFILAFILASILTFYLAFYLALSLELSLACVRVQAPSTASRARDMEFGLRRTARSMAWILHAHSPDDLAEENGEGEEGEEEEEGVAPLFKSRDWQVRK